MIKIDFFSISWGCSTLNYGTNSAAEIFYNLIRQLIRDISGTLNVADHVIVFGKDLSSQDKALKVLLDRLSEKWLTVNPKKCAFYTCSVEFFGYVLSNERISASPNKVSAVKEASSATNVTEMRSYLGLTNYCARFIPNYATLPAPLSCINSPRSTVDGSGQKHVKLPLTKLRMHLAARQSWVISISRKRPKLSLMHLPWSWCDVTPT